ncbi:chitobiase/beta-hexosaminidase C-terminal domain-containing protein [Paenibacillus glycinis]|uniref:SLH domain-containing protein n=1 Tax=Paenibacillus glycinis TaxID=2697035 RepID=A0ABW9XX43_9BACL|nr:chitobiase/beta-hexosaminidase C-terminal domain-containing protein [Paenibacillus glycinis]NBD27275.1 hypothetical protein [Paenibacillus glycinis]
MTFKLGTRFAAGAVALAVVAGLGGWKMLTAQADSDYWSDHADIGWYDPTYATYTIDTPAKLAGIAKLVNDGVSGSGQAIDGFGGKVLEITGDMDVSAYKWVPIGTAEHPFHGTLIAAGGAVKTISGMTVDGNTAYAGFVGNMDAATVGGLTFAGGGLDPVTVAEDVYAGAAVGKMTGSSTLYDITVGAGMHVKAESASGAAYAGGIAGSSEGTVSNVQNNAAVTASGSDVSAGGIVGDVGGTGLKLKKIWNYGAVFAAGSIGAAYAGGVAGYAPAPVDMGEDDTPILNAGAVQAAGGTASYAGGIIGRASGPAGFSTATANSGGVNVSAPEAAGSYAGGLAGALDTLTDGRSYALPFANTGAVTNDGGTNVYTGGVAGFVDGALAWDGSLANEAGVRASGGSEVYSGGLFGYVSGELRLAGTASNAAGLDVTGGARPAGPDKAYTGGLIGFAGSRLLFDNAAAEAYANRGAIAVVGGKDVYTGGIAGNRAYARMAGEDAERSDNVLSAGNIDVTGVSGLYTGGFIGAVRDGVDKTVSNAAYAGTINVVAASSDPSEPVATGGIVGYFEDAEGVGALSADTFGGTIAATGGGADTYTGGIAGYVNGGKLDHAAVGAEAGSHAVIAADGVSGGVAGYMQGAVDTAAVRFVDVTAKTGDGIVGGIAGIAGGSIAGATVGDEGAADSDSVLLAASGGIERLTAGGIVGRNEGPLAVTDSAVVRIGLLSEAGRSGLTLGGAAGKLTAEAQIGAAGAPVAVKQLDIAVNAADSLVGGGIGSSASSGVYLDAEQIAIAIPASGATVGGIAGLQEALPSGAPVASADGGPALTVNGLEITAAGDALEIGGLYGRNAGVTQSGAAEDVAIAATGAANRLGGIAGRNTGNLADASAGSVRIETSGADAEAGGIAGRSETPEGRSASASLERVRVLAGEEALVHATGANAAIGGIVGSARQTAIGDFCVSGELPDYAMLTAEGTGAAIGGIAGASVGGAIAGDGSAVNADNVNLTAAASAESAKLGGIVGSNDGTALNKVFSGAVNLLASGPNATAGGMAGYNRGSGQAVIKDSNTAALSIKVGASGTSAVVGGIVGLNDARDGDADADPLRGKSTIQNSRAVGTIQASAPDAIVGGLVGENRSLIANSSISDKIAVSSAGKSGTIGGLVGLNGEKGTVYYGYSNANLTVKGENALAGGLVGENRGSVLASYVDIDITGDAAGTSGHSVYLGGLIGRNAGKVDKSYSVSKVTANGSYSVVGGLVGEQSAGSIANSYTAKEVIAKAGHSYAGGFLGRLSGGKVETAYSASRVTAGAGAFAGGFAGRYDNASKELLFKTYYVKDVEGDINGDLPDFAEGNYIWLNVYSRLSTILTSSLKDREYFPTLSGWDFGGTWRYASKGAAYQYPELIRTANSGDGGDGEDGGSDVNANINWYLRDKGASGFEIRTEAELAGLAAIVNGSIPGVDAFSFEDRAVKLMNPIHIQSNQWVPIGIDENHPFQGNFDGDGQLIDGLSAPAGGANTGLFGVIGERGTAEDIRLEPLSIAGTGNTGALAGWNKGMISNAEVKLLNGTTIGGGTAGGLLGKNTGILRGLSLELEGGSRIEAVGANPVAGGLIGDNAGTITPDSVAYTLANGSVGSAADNATVGGLIGWQSGDMTGFRLEIPASLVLSAEGKGDTLGGMIGRQLSGKADSLTVIFAGGNLRTDGAASVLGGVIGQSDAGAAISNVVATGAQDGPQLAGNGTVGGIVGSKKGLGGGSFDLDGVRVDGLALDARGDGAPAAAGGIAGKLTDAALRNAAAGGTVRAAGAGIDAGGIVGRAEDSLLTQIDARMTVDGAGRTGQAAIGGVAGTLAATDPDKEMMTGTAAPYYPGIYNAVMAAAGLTADGTSQAADLYVGGIAGRVEAASVYYADSKAALTVGGGNTSAAGGIAGYSDGIIVNTTATGGIQADDSRVYAVGGAVGQAAGGELHYVRALSSAGGKLEIGRAVTLAGKTPATHAGGLIGMGDNAAIADSYAELPVAIDCDNPDNTIYAGGFAGLLGGSGAGAGTIDRAYATGALRVQGMTGAYVGGFVGSVDRYTVTGAYASGSVDNAGFDTQSGGFAGVVERAAVIRGAYAAQPHVATKGVNHPARSYVGGFAGYNDGLIDRAYAGVPSVTVDAGGANAFNGAFVGYNFRNGKITASSYAGTASGIGRNLGAADATATETDPIPAYGYDRWNFDLDPAFLSASNPDGLSIGSAAQLNAAVKLSNDGTALAYFRLFDRTAADKPELGHLTLGADIVMDGHVWVPFEAFRGSFDGKGKTIAGLKGTAAEGAAYGFAAENYGTIADIRFVDADISGGDDTGIAAGINREGATLSGIELSGSVRGGDRTGGAAGTNEGAMTGIALGKASIGGANDTGGLAGLNKGTIEGSFADAKITSTGELAGGIAGTNEGAISRSYASGGMNDRSAAAITRGGIAGLNAESGDIRESFSYMDIAAAADRSTVGGIAGENRGTIREAYYTGSAAAEGASGSRAGGIAGYAASGSIRGAFGAGEAVATTGGSIVPGKNEFGGIAGRKDAAASIAATVFNKQMLKADTAYYGADGKRVAGGTAAAAGLSAADLAGGSLPAGLDAGTWIAEAGFYPQLAAFEGNEAAKLGAAAVVLNVHDTIYRVRSGFGLSGGGLAWSADPRDVALSSSGGSQTGSLKTAGSAVLTAKADGYERSFLLNAAAPLFAGTAAAPAAASEPKGPIFTDTVTVRLDTEEPDGMIHYTLDGSEPGADSAPYAGPILINHTTTVRAVTIAEDKEPSTVFAGTWTRQSFGGIMIPPPEAEPEVTASVGSKPLQTDGGETVTVAKNSKLTLTAPEGHMIYYTTDGSMPTKNSPVYRDEILVTGAMTIKFITDADDRVITINCTVENAKYELKRDAKNVKYISGTGDREFKPNAPLTRYEMTDILSRLLDTEEVSVGNVFGDVERGREEAVAFFTSAGILSGYPDGTFRGGNGLTRAEFVVILSRVFHLNAAVASGKPEFADASSHWARGYIEAFAKAGYIKGFPDGSFKPDGKITRAQAVVLINGIVGRGLQLVTAPRFDDVPPGHWAYPAIMAAAK